MKKQLGDWNKYLDSEFNKEYFKKLDDFLDKEYKENIIYPSMDNIFKAFILTQYKDTKVVILGQDPYHEAGQAMGLAFSVPNNIKLPPSLVNIFKEINNEYGINNTSGDLTSWAKQGVLLLNTVLTVKDGKANSHKNIGWETFTNRVIEILNEKAEPVVFVLWGSDAIKKEALITNSIHKVLISPHPSPLSSYRGFFGCGHFKKINEILLKNYKKEIDWKL